MKVLIVEDSTSARKLLRYTFEHYHCTVIEAQDGQEGLEQAACHKPDMIISDALMPRMDGFQLLRAVKSDPELNAIPFVFYSSTYTGEKEVELALSLGAEAFVAKPVEPEKLWEKVCEIKQEWEARQRKPAHPPINESDEQYLREYSRMVAAKLEQKVGELEEALIRREQAEDGLRTLNTELGREIGEHIQAEETLRQQEQELATIFENTPFVMLLLDGDRRVRRVNGLACTFSGSTINNLLGRRIGEALRCVHTLDCSAGCGFGPHCQACAVRQTVVATYETGQSFQNVETRMPISVDGTEQIITFLFSTSNVLVAGYPMVLLSFQDISDYKRLESQLQHAQKMESIGTLAGGIAHDFNNILTVIFGYGDMTLLSMAHDDPHRLNVEHMLEAARRAANLAQDLLLFSRRQSGEKSTVDLNEIVRSVDKFLQRIIGEDITCTITLSDGKMSLFADAHQLEQVLINLATNARDALPRGGSLAITTACAELDEPDSAGLGNDRSRRYAVLTVTDTGIGMDDKTRRQIFDPFYTTKEVGKGTGLGLAVVYGIIKQHDGRITVDSEPGQGTTFRIYLPLSAAQANGNKIVPLNIQPERGTETILLAEDDETVRNMALALLESFGYNVIVAVDGEDAVQRFRENRERIQLLLFDVIMPKKSGIAAYDEIRAIEPGVRVIFASGYASDSVHQQRLADDHVMLIAKPYLAGKLLAMVRSAINAGGTSPAGK
ncbi:MAG: response regulator [Geobacteraceae bacterium]|nr:response regulator [Geobacteraceae bacterium]